MKMTLTFSAPDRETWRRWLQEHSGTEKEVWLIFDKKESGRACIEYEEAVEEALCFGWIDSIIQKIDEASYGRKFNPRTNFENWSATNLRRMQKVIAEGRMTEAGLKCIDPSLLAKDPKELERRDDLEAFEQVKALLRQNLLAWQNFEKLAPSLQKRYLGWICSAKQEATRLKRVEEVMGYLEKNEKMPMK
jgi:uncharacterized protein YdeI (YjbR/CyaY-like superfamily)